MTPSGDSPLTGFEVVDISEGPAGAYCTRLLAGLGADVIKVERPEGGDPTRRLGPFPYDRPDPELGALHLHLNAGKKSVALDIHTSEGREKLLRLVASADLFVDSLTQRQASELRLSAQDLRPANPRLHLLSVTPWGRSGPYCERPGTELMLEAVGGVASLHGDPPRRPLKLPGWQMECLAGTHAAIAALAMLMDTEGGPHDADVAAIECVLNAMEPRLTAWEYTKAALPRASYTYSLFYPLNIWPCKDGYLALTHYYPRDWDAFALVIGDDDLRENERCLFGVTRFLYQEEFNPKLNALLAERTMAEVFELTVLVRSATGMVLDADRLLTDPHLIEREAFAEVEHPVAGRYTMPVAPFKSSNGGWRTARAPLLGEHTDDVLQHLAGSSAKASASPGGKPRPGPYRPLAGMRVLDLSTAWAAPYTNRLLGALGADVIKIESSTYYDVWRGPVDPPPGGLGEYPDNDPGERPYERTPLFGTSNRNKRGLGLDLSRPEGREVIIRLLKKSDAVVSNFSVRVLPNFGLDYETLREAKPDIVMLVMPAYGATGPYRNGIAYGSTIEAMAGFSSRFGYKDGIPTLTHELTYGDPVAGAHGVAAVLSALLHKRRTGEGAFIDLSQQETLLAQTGEGIVKYSLDGHLIGREECGAFSHAPHGYYPCQGADQWVAISADDDDTWRALVEVIGSPSWAADGRFARNESRLAHQDALDWLLSLETASWDKVELADRLVAAGVAAAPVLSLEEVRADRHLATRQAFEVVDHPEVGRRTFQRMPVILDGDPLLTVRPAPLFAQHNDEICRELLGMSAEEVASLREAGVIADHPINPFPVDRAYYRVILKAVEEWVTTRGAELLAAAARGEASGIPVDTERFRRIWAAIQEMKAEEAQGGD